ncbi:hypothetical protein YC2023_077557 [Brassica napus]
MIHAWSSCEKYARGEYEIQNTLTAKASETPITQKQINQKQAICSTILMQNADQRKRRRETERGRERERGQLLSLLSVARKLNSREATNRREMRMMTLTKR